MQPKKMVFGIGFNCPSAIAASLSHRTAASVSFMVLGCSKNIVYFYLVFRPPAPRSWDDNQGERGAGDGDEKYSFPPGEHPLEGVPNVADLAAPETLSAKVDLSEVSFLQLLRSAARFCFC